jgi:hypothetical protein
MLAIAIGAAVLLLIAGLWYAFGPAKKKTPFLPDGTIAPGTRGVMTAPGLGSMADIIIAGTDPRTGKPYGKIASDVDLTNEANKKIVRKMSEDLASGSPGAMLPWKHPTKCKNILLYDVGRLALASEKGDSSTTMIPGFVTPGGQPFVPIEFTKPYSFYTYDRAKYMILISGTIDTSLSPVVIPESVAVYNKKTRDFEKSFDFSKQIKHKAQGQSAKAISDALNTDLTYKKCTSVGGLENGAYIHQGYFSSDKWEYQDVSCGSGSGWSDPSLCKWQTIDYTRNAVNRVVARLQSIVFEPFL